jgi:sugar lactone lactonase YvrE
MLCASWNHRLFARTVRKAPRRCRPQLEALEIRLAPAAPVVVTGAAVIASSGTGATLNGTVNPQGSTTAARFQYSTDPTFTPTVATYIGSGFSAPRGVAVDAYGDVFVADYQNNAVKEVLPNGTIRTIGSGFNYPQGVAVDAAGDVFVADTNHHAVKEVLPNGTIRTIGSGFSSPTGVAVDAAGDVFVADTNHNAVKEVLPNGTILTIGSGFNRPTGVAVDAAGDVFVADSQNDAVKEVLPNGTIRTIGSRSSYRPYGVAVDAAGDVFVDDNRNNRVVELSPPAVAATPSPLNGYQVTAISANLTRLAPDTVYYYRAVATGHGGTVAAQALSLLTVPPPVVATAPATAVTTTGATLHGTVNPQGPTTTARFQYSTDPAFTPNVATTIGSGFLFPSGVAVDAAGDVFVADTNHNAVKEVLPNGTIRTIGSGFSYPSGVAVDAAGDVFVADT